MFRQSTSLCTISFDTIGFLASEVVDLLHRVQRVMHSNVMSLRSMNVVFTRIGFAEKFRLKLKCKFIESDVFVFLSEI
jgi:hypothetical protein